MLPNVISFFATICAYILLFTLKVEGFQRLFHAATANNEKSNLLRMLARTKGKFAVGDLAKPPLDKESFVQSIEGSKWERLEAHLLIDPKLESLQSLREELGKKCNHGELDWQVYEHVQMPDKPGYLDAILGDNRGLWPQHRRLLITIPFEESEEETIKAQLQEFVGKLVQQDKLEMCKIEDWEPGPMADVIKYGLVWESAPFPSELPDTAFAICRFVQLNWASESRISNGMEAISNFQNKLLENGALWCRILQADEAISVVKTIEIYKNEDSMLDITNSTLPSFLEELAPNRAAVNLVSQAHLPVSSCTFPVLRTRMASSKWMPRVVFPIAASDNMDSSQLKETIFDALQIGYRHFFLQGKEEAAIFSDVLRKADQDLQISRSDIFISFKYQIIPTASSEDIRSDVMDMLSTVGITKLDAIIFDWQLASSKSDKGSLKSSWSNVHEEFLSMDEQMHIGTLGLELKPLHIEDPSVPLPDIILTSCHPLDPQPEIQDFCQEKGIILMANFFDSPKADGNIHLSWEGNQQIKEVSEGNQRKPTQTVLAWNLKMNNSVLCPFTNNASEISSNYDLQTYNLLSDDLEKLKSLTDPDDEEKDD
mmetsp:Transcript_18160/g.23414  ORF Transcript_18160/g.23414 Transcript_18160/m.23414 type:complete len:598 (-) Transcript_18160:211-2004(-)